MNNNDDDDDERSEEEETSNNNYYFVDDDSHYYGGSTVLNYDFNGRLEVKFDNTTPYQVDSIDKIFDLDIGSGSNGKRRSRGFQNAGSRLRTYNIY